MDIPDWKFWDTFENFFVSRVKNSIIDKQKVFEDNEKDADLGKKIDCLFAFDKDNTVQDGEHTIMTKSSAVLCPFEPLFSSDVGEHVIPIKEHVSMPITPISQVSKKESDSSFVCAHNLMPNHMVTSIESIELVRIDGNPIDWDDISSISFINNGMEIDKRRSKDMEIEHTRMCNESKKVSQKRVGGGGILSFLGLGGQDKTEEEEASSKSLARYNIGDWICSKSEPFLKTHASRWKALVEIKDHACRNQNPLYQFVVRYRKADMITETDDTGYVFGDNHVEFSSRIEALNALMHVIEYRLMQRIVQHQYLTMSPSTRASGPFGTMSPPMGASGRRPTAPTMSSEARRVASETDKTMSVLRPSGPFDNMPTKSERVSLKLLFNHLALGIIARMPKNVMNWSLVLNREQICDGKKNHNDNGIVYFPLLNTLSRRDARLEEIATFRGEIDYPVYSRDILFSKVSNSHLFTSFSHMDDPLMIIDMDVKEKENDKQFETKFGNYISISAYTINAMIGSNVCFSH